MQKTRLQFYLAFVLLLSFTSCKKDGASGTSTTTYQMTATIDGTLWQSKNIDQTNIPIKWKKVSTSSKPYYEITGTKATSLETISLRINTNSLVLNTDYILNITDPYTIFLPNLYQGLTPFVGYTGISGINTSGKVRITRFDGTKMSGTFEMRLANLNSSTGNWTYKNITNGVFTDATQ